MNVVQCPGRIVYDLGDGFAVGCIGGTAWYFLKGAYYSVRRERIKGGIHLLRTRAPILGGSFALWTCCFAISSCALVWIRKKEDYINSIASGAATGFVLAIRGGLKSAARSALFGGIFLGIIELFGVLMTQHQKRSELIEKNKEIDEFKREYERAHGIKLRKSSYAHPAQQRRDQAKAEAKESQLLKDPAAKLL
jgi:import inner membrane translocase subunit TIM17